MSAQEWAQIAVTVLFAFVAALVVPSIIHDVRAGWRRGAEILRELEQTEREP